MTLSPGTRPFSWFGTLLDAQAVVSEAQALAAAAADHGGMIPLVLPDIFEFFDGSR
jgi:hypothetical protein